MVSCISKHANKSLPLLHTQDSTSFRSCMHSHAKASRTVYAGTALLHSVEALGTRHLHSMPDPCCIQLRGACVSYATRVDECEYAVSFAAQLSSLSCAPVRASGFGLRISRHLHK